jgi:hypothetical protein
VASENHFGLSFNIPLNSCDNYTPGSPASYASKSAKFAQLLLPLVYGRTHRLVKDGLVNTCDWPLYVSGPYVSARTPGLGCGDPLLLL